METLTSFDFLDLLFLLIAVIAFFLLVREIVLWYYKINERITLQKETNTLLIEIRDLLKPIEDNTQTDKQRINFTGIKGVGDVNDPEVFDSIIGKIKKD